MAKEKPEDPYECGYVELKDVPMYPSAEEAGIANRENMRWQCEPNLEMEGFPNGQPEDPAAEAVHEDGHEEEY